MSGGGDMMRWFVRVRSAISFFSQFCLYKSVLKSDTNCLPRNIDYFYLQAERLDGRPPRAHRLAAVWQKLWGFLRKFESLARDLEVRLSRPSRSPTSTPICADHAAYRLSKAVPRPDKRPPAPRAT